MTITDSRKEEGHQFKDSGTALTAHILTPSGLWTQQDVPITILRHKLSRVYAAPLEERLQPLYNTPLSKYETIN